MTTYDVIVLGAGPVGRGMTFVGPGVSELLPSATIAVVAQVPVERLWHAVPCFPALTEVWLRLLEAHRDAAVEG